MAGSPRLANYFEQLNIEYERRVRGVKNVLNRREQISQGKWADYIEDMTQKYCRR